MSRLLCVEAAGFPCEIEERNGDWFVTFAAVSVAQGPDLAKAIIRASGGRVGADEANAIVVAVKRSG